MVELYKLTIIHIIGFYLMFNNAYIRRSYKSHGNIKYFCDGLACSEQLRELTASEWIISFSTKYYLQGTAKKFYMRNATKVDGYSSTSFEFNRLKKSLNNRVVDSKEKIQVFNCSLSGNNPEDSKWPNSIFQVNSGGNVGAASQDIVVCNRYFSQLEKQHEISWWILYTFNILRNPGYKDHPHRTGILFVIEPLDANSTVCGNDSIELQRNVNKWKRSVLDCGFVLIKQREFVTEETGKLIAFAFAKINASPSAFQSPSIIDELSDFSNFSRSNLIDNGFIPSSRFQIPSILEMKRYSLSHEGCVGIIGGGLSGAALGLHLQKAGIPFKIFEKDDSFSARKQGYALTVQQGSTTLRSLGLLDYTAKAGFLSLAHVSLTSGGSTIGTYGVDNLFIDRQRINAIDVKTMSPNEYHEISKITQDQLNVDKRHNFHIPRQSLREILIQNINSANIFWGKKLSNFEDRQDNVHLLFDDDSTETVSMLVAADGIHSTVRKRLDLELPETLQRTAKLNYLGLVVILGISRKILVCEHQNPSGNTCGRYQIQWVDGFTRVFTMPFDEMHTMWQLSFPMSEVDAAGLSGHQTSLKVEALKKIGRWHSPLAEMIACTDESLVSGHPVYDRSPFSNQEIDLLEHNRMKSRVTVMGDAAHPMSPMKGQGANQALLDATALSKHLLSSNIRGKSHRSIQENLREYEREMWTRSSLKVLNSRRAAEILHSNAVLRPGNFTRASVAGQGITAATVGSQPVAGS